MSQNSVAIPPENSEKSHYHRLDNTSCETEQFILSNVDSAYHEQGFDPCPECDPPLPENARNDDREQRKPDKNDDGKKVEENKEINNEEQKQSSTEAQWGQAEDNEANNARTNQTQGESESTQQQLNVSENSSEGEQQDTNFTTEKQPATENTPTERNSDSVETQSNTSPSQDSAEKNTGLDEASTQSGQEIDQFEVGDEESELVTSLNEETESALEIQPDGDNNPHLTDRVSPDEANSNNDELLDIPNRTQDMVKFEYVMDEDDDIGAEDINQAGMVSLGSGRYAAIASIEPREWSVLKDSDKEQVIQKYKSAFISPLDSSLQIVEYPSEFDISEHLTKIENTRKERQGDPDTNPLIQAGRKVYPKWLKGFIDRNGMKQRKFYMIVTISEDQLSQFGKRDNGMFAGLRDKYPLMDSMISRVKSEESDETEMREKCLRELHTRMKRLKNGLKRFNVESERLDDRDEVMQVFYEYYNDCSPFVDEFQTDQVTTGMSTTNQ